MRILRLDLIAFGPFRDVSLDFTTPAARPGVHLVYGPNEAGKSSTLRALRAALFGFPPQTADNFLHEYKALRVGATLKAADGTTLSFVRRKGAKNTLLAADGQTALPDDALRPFLGGVKEDEFYSMFAIGHAALRAGGQEVLHGQGRLGEMLFMATAGLPRLRRVEQSLGEEAGKLFLRTGKNPAINDALARIADLRKAQKEKYLRPEEFTRHTAALDAAKTERAVVEEEIATCRIAKARLDRHAQALPTVARLKQHRAALEAVSDAPRLPADFTARREALERESRSLAGRLEQLQEQLDAAAAKAKQLDVPEELLAAAAEIERLFKRLGSHEKAAVDSRERRVEADQFEGEARSLLRSIRPELDLDGIDGLRLRRQEQADIRELAAQLRELAAQHREHDAESQRLASRSAQAAAELDRLGPEQPVDRLRGIVRRATREGQLDEALAAAETDAAALARRIDSGVAALSSWSGAADELVRAPVPSAATIDRFEAAFAAIENEAQLLRKQRADLEQKLRTAERTLERTERDGDVPDIDSLRASRQHRDAGWQEIRRELDGLDAGPERDGFLAGASSLPDAFEAAVQRSDTIADRLRNEAERVERLSQCRHDAERLRADLVQVSEATASLEQQRNELTREWATHWRFLTAAPLTPREMRDWSSRHAELSRLAEQHRTASTKATELRERLEGLRNELTAALEELAVPVPDRDDLRSFVDEAERTLERCDAAAERRRTLLADQQRATQDHEELEAAAAANRSELKDVQGRWAERMARLGLTETSGGEAALAVLDTLGDVFQRVDAVASLNLRIEAMRDDARAFENDVRNAVTRLAPDLASLPFERAAAELNARLGEARTRHETRNELASRRETLARDLEDSARKAGELDRDLQALCRQAGCRDAAELPLVEQRAAERRRLETQVEQAEEELRLRSGGQTVAAFLAEINAVDPDTIELDLERVAKRLDDLQDRRVALERTITEHEQELARMTGGADAATAAEDTEVVIARLAGDVEQYARLRIAARLLRDGRERYRQKSGNAVLDRAGELFATLTNGRFSGLAVDYGENDEPRLLGARAEGTPVEVDGMSDGTADQLYLALRLAGLSAWLDSHDPLPFVVDDILVHFDDARSEAALRALASLADRTQVILFTHHDHLVEIARRTLPADTLHVHSLAAAEQRDEREPATNGKSKRALF